jgi:hypothetical protein
MAGLYTDSRQRQARIGEGFSPGVFADSSQKRPSLLKKSHLVVSDVIKRPKHAAFDQVSRL